MNQKLCKKQRKSDFKRKTGFGNEIGVLLLFKNVKKKI